MVSVVGSRVGTSAGTDGNFTILRNRECDMAVNKKLGKHLKRGS